MRFELRLSRQLGMTWRELKQRMHEYELALQIAYERVEPIEDGWIQSANLICLVANMMRERGTRAYTMGDVYRHLKADERPPSAEVIEAQMHAWAIAHNASLAKGG